MSNYLALAAVTAAFGRLITRALQAVPNLSAAPELRIGQPPADPGFVGANLFLYRTAPSAARRNDDLATRDAGGMPTRRPQAALDLDYMISFYGSDARLEPHRLMGSAVALLHAYPVLTAADIRAAIDARGADGVLAGADLDQQIEPVRFTMVPLGVEDMHRIWSLYYSLPYALSVAYTGSTVLLDADVAAGRAPPARRAVIRTRPMMPPRIDALTPPVVPFGAGAKLTIAGSNFSAPAHVAFGALAAPAVPVDGGLEAVLPAGLRAGVNPVRVVVADEAGAAASGAAVLAESSDAVFVLAPRVADGALWRRTPDPRTGATIETVVVNLAPLPALAQPVQLFLNPLPGAGPRPPATGSVTPLRFGIDGSLAADLDRGIVSRALHNAFAANGVTLAHGATVAVERAGTAWRVSDHARAFRLMAEGGRIAVHFGLAPDDPDGSLAFEVRDLAAGSYLVSVQVGDQSAATSPLRWGRRLFQVAASPADLDHGSLPPAVAAAFAHNGIVLSARLTIARPMPGDGWDIRDQGSDYWARQDGDSLTLFELDADGAIYFGPAVTIPASGAGA